MKVYEKFWFSTNCMDCFIYTTIGYYIQNNGGDSINQENGSRKRLDPKFKQRGLMKERGYDSFNYVFVLLSNNVILIIVYGQE